MEWSKKVNLAKELARADFKLRYHGSYLGYLWSFLKPLLVFGVLFVVFSKFLKIQYPDYALNLFLGIILWNFFAEATAGSMAAILEKGGLIKKIYFAREIIVISAVTVSFLTLLSNLAVFALFYAFLKPVLAWTMLLFVIFLLSLYAITLGCSLFLSALYAKFRDLFHMWQVALQMGFWATPIVYVTQIVADKYQILFFLNPFADIITNSRRVLISHEWLDPSSTLYVLAASGIMLAAGYFVFRQRMPYFAEEV